MPVTAAVIAAGGSIAGGYLSKKSSQSTTPTMDPAYGPLQNMVLSSIQNRLNSSPDMSGFTGSGVADINKTYEGADQNLTNSLTARGLNSSPVAGAGAATLQAGRASDIARFRNSIPLLKDALQRQNLTDATGLLGIGRGVSTTASSGGGPAGAAESLAAYLGYLNGKGAFGRGATDPYAAAGGFGTVATSY